MQEVLHDVRRVTCDVWRVTRFRAELDAARSDIELLESEKESLLAQVHRAASVITEVACDVHVLVVVMLCWSVLIT